MLLMFAETPLLAKLLSLKEVIIMFNITHNLLQKHQKGVVRTHKVAATPMQSRVGDDFDSAPQNPNIQPCVTNVTYRDKPPYFMIPGCTLHYQMLTYRERYAALPLVYLPHLAECLIT